MSNSVNVGMRDMWATQEGMMGKIDEVKFEYCSYECHITVLEEKKDVSDDSDEAELIKSLTIYCQAQGPSDDWIEHEYSVPTDEVEIEDYEDCVIEQTTVFKEKMDATINDRLAKRSHVRQAFECVENDIFASNNGDDD